MQLLSVLVKLAAGRGYKTLYCSTWNHKGVHKNILQAINHLLLKY